MIQWRDFSLAAFALLVFLADVPQSSRTQIAAAIQMIQTLFCWISSLFCVSLGTETLSNNDFCLSVVSLDS